MTATEKVLVVLAFLINVAISLPYGNGVGGPLDQFTHKTSPNGISVGNAAISPSPIVTKSADDCGAACLANPLCVSFSYQTVQGTCVLSKYSPYYTVNEGGGPNLSYYLKIIPRKDVPVTPAIQYVLKTPTRGVTLANGTLNNVFQNGIKYLQGFPLDDLLFFYRQRAGNPSPPGKCWGWDLNLRGSISGLFMMGAGNTLRWEEHNDLKNTLDSLVAGIKTCQQSNGFIMAYNENQTKDHENPDYVLSWVTHGLIDAAIQGNEGALQLIRDQISWFNYNEYLPEFMPPNDIDVPPMYGTPTGHQIYLIFQGIIHNTLMALSPLGLLRDLELVRTLYQEDTWLNELINMNVSGIWQRKWFPHNYEVTAFEAYFDMYILTGNETYLNAVNGAWQMFYMHWIHVGGSMAINEGSPQYWYPPGSYYLECTGTPPPSPSSPSPRAPPRAPPQCGGPSIHTHKHSSIPQLSSDECHATGETCGSVFWIKLNQRYHNLYPDAEKYVTEIEREIYNVIAANQDPSGFGNRYFALLHKYKQTATNVGSCCESQASRLWGSLPEYLYSIGPKGIYVDMYAASTISWSMGGVSLSLVTDTQFPYSGVVKMTLKSSKPTAFDLTLRAPSWATTPFDISVNGKAVARASPGTYVHLSNTWNDSVITFTLPMGFRVTKYSGLTTIKSYSRYAIEYGPILLAATGPWDSVTDCLIIKGVDANNPEQWLIPINGKPLHFSVKGNSTFQYLPYFEVQTELFTVYPIIYNV